MQLSVFDKAEPIWQRCAQHIKVSPSGGTLGGDFQGQVILDPGSWIAEINLTNRKVTIYILFFFMSHRV